MVTFISFLVVQFDQLLKLLFHSRKYDLFFLKMDAASDLCSIQDNIALSQYSILVVLIPW